MKTLFKPFPPALLAAASLAIATAFSRAEIKNPGFEFLTAGWTQTGNLAAFNAPTSIIGVYQSINPVEGTHFGLVSNEGAASKTISTTFVVTGDSTSAKFLNFEYRFLTDEINQPLFDESARAVLTPASGAPITLVKVSRSDLQASNAVALLPGAAYLDTQKIGQSRWQTSSTDVSAYLGQTVTLSFTVDNGSDSAFLVDSALALDNLRLTDVADTLPPALFVKTDAVVHTRKAAFVLRGSAGDKNGIRRVEVKVGKAGFKPATGTNGWKFTAQLKPGRNLIRIRSIDGAGNISAVSQVTIYRD